MAIIAQWAGPDDTDIQSNGAGTVSQTFTVDSDYILESVTIKVWVEGTVANLYVRVFDAALELDELVILPTAGMSTASPGADVVVPIPNSNIITSGTTYTIAIYCLELNPNYIDVRVDLNDSEYTGGSFFLSGGFELEGTDAVFSVTGSYANTGQATTPVPADAAVAQTLHLSQLAWDNGTPAADTFNVYFGPTGSMVLVSLAQAGTTYSLSSHLLLDYNTEYSWRIDTTSSLGTTTGEVWTFTTTPLYPPIDKVAYKRLVVAANNKIWYEAI